MKSRFFCFLIFIIFFSGSKNAMLSKSERVTNSIIKKFALEQKKAGLFAIGIGGSEKDEKAETIIISFDIEKKLDLASARKLIIRTMNDFLILINNYKNIEHYLIEYPLTIRNLNFHIFCQIPKNLSDDHVSIVTSNNGIIYYKQELDDSQPLLTIHSETFEEACKIINEQQ